jgi:hypothetical protein
MHMKFHGTSLHIHSLVYIPLQLFSFLLFLLHYRTEATVCQNIFKVTVHCTAARPKQHTVDCKELNQGTAHHTWLCICSESQHKYQVYQVL